MNLDDIAVPSNFAALTAILRSMMPPECIQRDGYPGHTTAINSTDEYVEHLAIGKSARDAVRAWWTWFAAYVKERGGHAIIWRARPEYATEAFDADDFAGMLDDPPAKHGFVDGETMHKVYGRLFIAKVPAPEVTW